jgi:hypothetical protein
LRQLDHSSQLVVTEMPIAANVVGPIAWLAWVVLEMRRVLSADGGWASLLNLAPRSGITPGVRRC